MSSGDAARKVKPRPASSNCRDETPRSRSTKSGRNAATRPERGVAAERRLQVGDPGVAKPRAGNGDRFGVAVDGKHRGTGIPERPGVAPVAEGRVDHPAGATGPVENRLEQDRLVEGAINRVIGEMKHPAGNRAG